MLKFIICTELQKHSKQWILLVKPFTGKELSDVGVGLGGRNGRTTASQMEQMSNETGVWESQMEIKDQEPWRGTMESEAGPFSVNYTDAGARQNWIPNLVLSLSTSVTWEISLGPSKNGTVAPVSRTHPIFSMLFQHGSKTVSLDYHKKIFHCSFMEPLQLSTSISEQHQKILTRCWESSQLPGSVCHLRNVGQEI